MSSPLKNQTDILQTLSVYVRCPAWMYTPGCSRITKVKGALLVEHLEQ